MDHGSYVQRPITQLLSPINDVVFKMLMAAPQRNHLLVAFVNAVLELATPITSLEIRNPEITSEMAKTKGSILDTLASTLEGRTIHIEMQSQPQPYFYKRTFLYSSRAFAGQLTKGDNYSLLRPVDFINLLNFRQFRDGDPLTYARTLMVMDKKSLVAYPELINMHFLEIPKFSKFIQKNPDAWTHCLLAQWLQFLTNPADKKMEKIIEINPTIEEAMKGLKDMSDDPRAQEMARIREKSRLDVESGLEYATERGFAKGRAKGRAEGKAEGEAKGRAAGKTEGKAEAKVQLLRSLLRSAHTSSLSDAEIARLVDLPLEDVADMRAALSAIKK